LLKLNAPILFLGILSFQAGGNHVHCGLRPFDIDSRLEARDYIAIVKSPRKPLRISEHIEQQPDADRSPCGNR